MWDIIDQLSSNVSPEMPGRWGINWDQFWGSLASLNGTGRSQPSSFCTSSIESGEFRHQNAGNQAKERMKYSAAIYRIDLKIKKLRAS